MQTKIVAKKGSDLRTLTDLEDDNSPLWRWSELATALNCPPVTAGPAITGISIDSRTAKTGDLFIALAGDPGPRFHTSSPGQRDGHDFVSAAAKAGAAGALVARLQPLDLPQLQVGDTLDGLWALGRQAAARHKGVRFAITGSSGKTTCKAFMSAALAAAAEPGSFNNFWGVPVCLARTAATAPHAIYEIGTNQAGEIEPLARLVDPQVAVLLNVHPAHLGNFDSLEALRKEKLSISNALDDLSQFVCEYSVAVAAGLASQVFTFGEETGAAVRLRELVGDRAVYATPNGDLAARVPGGGRHRALTLGAVLAALICAGEDPDRATELPATLVPNGRGNERLITSRSGASWVIVDDSYNANPASMTAALDALAASEGPCYAILGEMLELGDQSRSYHLDLASHCAGLAGVFCVGEACRDLFESLPQSQRLGYADRESDIDLPALLDALPETGRVLVKGSNRVFWQNDFCARLMTLFEAK